MNSPAKVQVRMLVCMAGVMFVRNAGDVVSVEVDEASRLVVAGFAEPLEAAVETGAPERAMVARVTPRGSRARRR